MTPTSALASYTKEQLKKALASQEDQVLGARVWLSDVNGPRGGVDKHCRFQIHLNGKKSVVVSETSENMYAAIARAARRVSTAVTRRVKRDQRFKRPGKRYDDANIDTNMFEEAYSA